MEDQSPAKDEALGPWGLAILWAVTLPGLLGLVAAARFVRSGNNQG